MPLVFITESRVDDYIQSEIRGGEIYLLTVGSDDGGTS